MMNATRVDGYSEEQHIRFDLKDVDCRDGATADQLLDGIGRGVIFVNNDGVLTSINRYAAKLLQVKRENVIGKQVDMLPLRTPIYRVLSEQRTGIPLALAIRSQVVAVQTTEIQSENGKIAGEMTELWDITEEKRSRRQSEEFVSMMTHDLRSPLSVIMGYIQGIQCGMFGEISSQLRTVVEKAEESGAKLNSMIEEMLDHFRLEVGLLNLNRQNCDMEKLLDGCYRDNLRIAQKQGVNLLLKREVELPELHVDSRQLIRAFNNLIGNAIKYTHSSGEVTIHVESGADAIHVSVVDTGMGIPAEDLPRIFFKYYRSAGATGIKGTGLGLAISKIIVEAHGGGIEVESHLGVGSTFTVTLPYTTLENDESAQPEVKNISTLRSVT
jgi:signal transduction histidine kinase